MVSTGVRECLGITVPVVWVRWSIAAETVICSCILFGPGYVRVCALRTETCSSPNRRVGDGYMMPRQINTVFTSE